MSFLIDTCAWIEWLTESKLANQLSLFLETKERLIVPTIVQFELYKWTRRERDEATAMEVIGITEQGNVVPIDTTLALYAADIAQQYQLAALDAIIYATSQIHKAILVTCDKHFKGLPGVKYFSK